MDEFTHFQSAREFVADGARLQCSTKSVADGASLQCAGVALTIKLNSLNAGAISYRSAISYRLLCLITLWIFSCSLANAQLSDSFEGGRPRWRLVESDCSAEISGQEISPALPQSGQTCETFELFCTAGTFAYLAMPVEPCALIDELGTTLWVQCSSSRVRLGVSVIFPHATNASTGGRVQTVLWGTTYDDPGQWQRLIISNCEQLLAQELPTLRQRYGSKVNFDDAYIDAIVLNGYTGPGRYRVKVDELSMPGMIPIASLGTPIPADWRVRWRWRDGVGTEELRWEQSSAARVPVWWQYQGENMPWLKSLGFQGLLLNRVPSDAMLKEAQAARLTIVAPPPTQTLAVNEKLWDGVKGWLVGAAVDGRGLDRLKTEVLRVSQFPSELQRPTIAEVMEDYWAFSRVVDELVVPAPSLVSAGTSREKQDWLLANLQSTKRLSSPWVSICTDALPGWREQVRQAQQIVEPAAEELDTADPMRVRQQVARAVAAGARGFLFRSNTPLDGTSTTKRARVAMMRTINRDLALLGPWISSGQVAVEPKLNRPDDYFAAAWIASRSHLVMFVAHTDPTDQSLPATRGQALRATMPLPTGIHNVLRITGGSIQSLLLTPGPDGMTWEIPDPDPIEFCLLTDNPLVEHFASRFVSDVGIEPAEDMLDIAGHQLGLAARITAARWPEPQDELSRRYYSTIAAGQRRVEQGYEELRRRRPAMAYAAATQALDAAQLIVHESYNMAISNLASPQSSALVLSTASLPYHWRLADSCNRSTWRSIPLPAAEFNSLDDILQAGWNQQRRLEDRAEMQVELVPNAATQTSQSQPLSKLGMRFVAFPKQGQALPGGYEGATIRVRSAPVQLQRGELVRITGQALIRKAPVEPGAGLLVYDNKGGPALGQLVRGQAGQLVPIELYRFITDDEPLRVLSELRGSCDIILQGISLSAIKPAVNTSIYPTVPAQP